MMVKTAGAFPFSITVDPTEDRLYLAGIAPEIGVIEQASGSERKERTIDRWIRWEGEPREEKPPLPHEPPPAPEGPSVIRLSP